MREPLDARPLPTLRAKSLTALYNDNVYGMCGINYKTMSLYNTGLIQWATSCGGPLILLPQPLLPQWLGCFRWCDEPHDKSRAFNSPEGAICVPYQSISGGHSLSYETPYGWLCENVDFMDPESCDYGRACAVKESRSFIAVGEEEALILDNEDNDDNPATWLAFPEGRGGILFQWHYLHVHANQDQVVEDAFRNHGTLKWCREAIWEIKHPELLLFDSAQAGALFNADEALLISLEIGTYSLTSAEYSQAPDLKLLTLHRLLRQ